MPFTQLQEDGVNRVSYFVVVVWEASVGATVVSSTQKQWDFDTVCNFRRAFPGCPSHGTFTIGESEEGLALNTDNDRQMLGDMDAEREIEAITAGVALIEESDTVGVLATLRQERTAMTQETLTRGLRQRKTIKIGFAAGNRFSSAGKLAVKLDISATAPSPKKQKKAAWT